MAIELTLISLFTLDSRALTMVLSQPVRTTALAVFAAFVFLLNANLSASQRLSSVPDYQLDPGLLDFVYHNHDETTRFMRYLFSTAFALLLLTLFFSFWRP